MALLVGLPLGSAVLLPAALLALLELWQECAPRRQRGRSGAKWYFLQRLRLLRAVRLRARPGA